MDVKMRKMSLPLEKSCDRKDGGLWPLKVKEATAEKGVKEALN